MKKLYSFFAVILSILFFSQGFYAFAVTKVFKNGVPATAGLVSYYQFENITSDFFGANTLTNNNGVATSTGKVLTDGAAFAADGGSANTNKNATTSSNLGIDGGSISIACWTNVTTAPTGFTVIAGQSSLNTRVEYMISYRLQTAQLKVQWHRNRYSVADDVVTAITTLTPGTWYHLALTYSSTSTILTSYLNGTSQGTTTGSGNGSSFATNGVAFLSRSTPEDDAYFSGLVDECGIWNIALTATDISNLYNSGTGQTMIIQTAAAVTRRRIMIIQ